MEDCVDDTGDGGKNADAPIIRAHAQIRIVDPGKRASKTQEAIRKAKEKEREMEKLMPFKNDAYP